MPFGIALLIAGLFFDAGIADSVQMQGDVTPTADRLAEPTLPAAPSQADHGAQVYWLSCMPCHGDQRSEEHTSELQSRLHLVCRLLLEKKKTHKIKT